MPIFDSGKNFECHIKGGVGKEENPRNQISRILKTTSNYAIFR